MERQLSQKWWNRIRREMRATPVTYTEPVQCPDCDAPAHLREGRYGRYYECERYQCKGTRGARLDGTPRSLPGGLETEIARLQAARAVGAVLDLCDGHEMLAKVFGEILGRAGEIKPLPIKHAGNFDGIDFEIRVAPLNGMCLRLRPIEDLRRIEAAARAVYQEKMAIRRRSAWDVVSYADDEGTLTPPPRDHPTWY